MANKGLAQVGKVEDKTMTVKELAMVLNVGESTIKRAIETLRPVLGTVATNTQGGYLLTEEQTSLIKQKIQRHHNLASRQIDSVNVPSLFDNSTLSQGKLATPIVDTTKDSGKTMTIQEVANVLGVDYKVIWRKANELGFTKNGVITRLTEEQVIAIKESYKNLSNIGKVCNSVTHKEAIQTIAQLQSTLTYDEAVKSALLGMKQVLDMNERRMAEAEAKLARTTEERDTLAIQLDEHKGYRSIKYMEKELEEDFSWRVLKAYSLKHGIPIKKIYDANYGEVNAYSIEVWKACYGSKVMKVL